MTISENSLSIHKVLEDDDEAVVGMERIGIADVVSVVLNTAAVDDSNCKEELMAANRTSVENATAVLWYSLDGV